ncbi:MAG: hypothetical protein ACRDN6_01330 [Gaiellaceae bacterium]
MRRRSLVVGLLAGLAAVVLLRRQRSARGEHVDLYYEDGSMVSLENGAPDAQRLLGLAREALRTAQR